MVILKKFLDLPASVPSMAAGRLQRFSRLYLSLQKMESMAKAVMNGAAGIRLE